MKRVSFVLGFWLKRMADNNENQSLEGGNGPHIESSNLEILMKSMAEMRQHQLLLEERLGILPPRHNSGSAEEFNGSPLNPERAEEWLQHAEHVLEHVTDDRDMWVKLATYRFRRPARDWWKAVMKADGEVMTWNSLKDFFTDKYVPDAARDGKFHEFMFLTKGGMSVSAYNDKFIRLSRYGADLIAIDEAKAKKFIRELDPEMRKQLSCLRIRIYEDPLNRSLDYEKEMEDQLATRVRERPQQFSARQGPAKRPMFSAPNQTFGRLPVRPWTTGSASAPPATRPPSVRPQGRWRDFPKNPPTGLTQQGAIYAMEPVVTTNQEESEESKVLYTMVEGDDSATDQVVEVAGNCDASGVDLGEGEFNVWVD
ncbi:hypothetical protein C5167_023107 [Papaver somniferum]|uniref:Retrotransposon gag domain-containing protein n=1 Tax=Papaver somniferum TaxID=3469 RepID=A0A4Y7JNN7_PAPSO|nr:hypothetical protein C5167_023107 [Papaver somniferum]